MAELRQRDGGELAEREDWSKPGRLDDFLPAFEDWRFGWLDVPALIRAAPEVWVYPMIDRDPLPRWSFGPVTLLGDAAHPMYPIGSNGASQAILDARVLTGCLRHHSGDPERGLARYDEIRRAATSEIVLANRSQGPEAAMQLVEDRAPGGFARIEDVVRADELAAIAEKYKRLAGFSVAELNARSLAAPTACLVAVGRAERKFSGTAAPRRRAREGRPREQRFGSRARSRSAALDRLRPVGVEQSGAAAQSARVKRSPVAHSRPFSVSSSQRRRFRAGRGFADPCSSRRSAAEPVGDDLLHRRHHVVVEEAVHHPRVERRGGSCDQPHRPGW